MKKFSLSLLTLITSITCSAAEKFENPVPDNEYFGQKAIENLRIIGFRKYVSFDISSLANLGVRVNFGVRNEIDHNGCDLGIFGAAGGGVFLGGYASYLYYFNHESNVNFYSGIGLDSGFLWTAVTYGGNARAIIPIGLNHFAQSGRHEFFQLSLFWPTVTFQKIYKDKERNYFFIRRRLIDISGLEWREANQYRSQKRSSWHRDLQNIGVSVNYGLFF